MAKSYIFGKPLETDIMDSLSENVIGVAFLSNRADGGPNLYFDIVGGIAKAKTRMVVEIESFLHTACYVGAVTSRCYVRVDPASGQANKTYGWIDSSVNGGDKTEYKTESVTLEIGDSLSFHYSGNSGSIHDFSVYAGAIVKIIRLA